MSRFLQLHLLTFYNQRQTFDQANPLDRESRQAERVAEFKSAVAKHFEGKLQTRRHFQLIFWSLRAQSKYF